MSKGAGSVNAAGRGVYANLSQDWYSVVREYCRLSNDVS